MRRKTLIATRSERAGKAVYSFTINLQGPDETVFFESDDPRSSRRIIPAGRFGSPFRAR